MMYPRVAVQLRKFWVKRRLVDAQEEVEAGLFLVIRKGVVVMSVNRSQKLFGAGHHSRSAPQQLVLLVGHRTCVLQGQMVAHEIVQLAENEDNLRVKLQARLR
eukprot:CAMPEP_0197714958 /NCGR_PEP_ID=MMETSP1338-20131121/131219_1 /TAXON_ID=43686 ORGANISM="Pelagodinium beii, Strain RCC1491" /NCGR_SAMPLE_ID=MMETSP1338 /ASSEMBLY_ACC=CAM_ASM_000754 /LENGTH=102 /DNA_ID=CAMNT_0043298901 /DNA_START=1900 /DNA_END=2208 /DNA_ORIENTATION=+